MAEVQATAEYRDIPGFPGYRAGSDGTIWTKRRKGQAEGYGDWKRMKAPPDSQGYPHVRLSAPGKRATYRVHVLVLLAFVGPCPDGHEGCHDDGDKANNRRSNLRWDTRRANQLDRVRHGRCGHCGRRVGPEVVRRIRAAYATGVSRAALAAEHHLSEVTIWQITTRKTHQNVA